MDGYALLVIVLVHRWPGEYLTDDSVADCGARPLPGREPDRSVLVACPVCIDSCTVN